MITVINLYVVSLEKISYFCTACYWLWRWWRGVGCVCVCVGAGGGGVGGQCILILEPSYKVLVLWTLYKQLETKTTFAYISTNWIYHRYITLQTINIYIYTYILTHARTHARTHAHTHTHTHTHQHTHTPTHTHTHTHAHTHTYIRDMHAYRYTHTHTHTHTRYACIHTHTQTLTHSLALCTYAIARMHFICAVIFFSVAIWSCLYLSLSQEFERRQLFMSAVDKHNRLMEEATNLQGQLCVSLTPSYSISCDWVFMADPDGVYFV